MELTQREVTMVKLVSSAVDTRQVISANGTLAAHQDRLPNDQGYDEWYGIPRTADEAFPRPADPPTPGRGRSSLIHIMQGRKAREKPRSRGLRLDPASSH